MQNHRLRPFLDEYRLPEPRTPSISAEGFMACPLPLIQDSSAALQQWQNTLYQLAFEQTQFELRPSLPERDLLAIWN
jgi:hypothetical protein